MRTYHGIPIHNAERNSSGIRYNAHTSNGIVRADTLAGIKEAIRASLAIGPRYQLIVGNLGTIATGNNKRAMMRDYREACADVDMETGRASGESVTLFCNDEVIAEKNAARAWCDVLSIDAWRDGDGWTWNNWHKVGRVPVEWCDMSARQLFAAMRARGFLGSGDVARDDDGYNVTISTRANGEPIFALAYGAVA